MVATEQSFDCQLVRMATVERRPAAQLTPNGFRYTVARGQTSIEGVNGPAA